MCVITAFTQGQLYSPESEVSKEGHKVVTKKVISTKRKLNLLKEHPQQNALFGDVSDEELASLAEHIEQHGLQHPVEIAPDGTIITGHQRVRAARRLGWTEIEVVIRHDLAQADPAIIEAHLINDNFVRRQLSPLGRGRCIKRLMELEVGRSADRFGSTKREKLKARIASQMKLSLRTVSRYLLVLQAPTAVQQAFDRAELPLIVAGKVAMLSQTEQALIAKRIENGENAANVVAEHLTRPEANGDPIGKSLNRLVNAMRREVPILRGRAAEIDRRQLALRSRWLLEARDLLHDLVNHVRPESG
jgi:ParB/RepB/Spo0J family partition protein